MRAREPALQFVLEIASQCNLNCGYCYVYHHGDETWRDRPRLMSEEVFEATLARIRRYCELSGQKAVQLTFDGGEPTLIGAATFERYCRRIQRALADIAQVRIRLQTNGVSFDEQWVEVCGKYAVEVGISIDGPPEVHDAHRVDHTGDGSHGSVVRAFRLLRRGGISVQIIAVIPLGRDGIRVHRYFVDDLGAKRIDYHFPDHARDTIESVHAAYGPTPCADFLIPIFDDWWQNDAYDVEVGVFWNVARVILGAESLIDFLGNRPLRSVFIETDGSIEGPDVLRVRDERLASTGLNVLHHDISAIATADSLHRRIMFDGMPLPEECGQCPESDTCAGGYLPHRYTPQRLFDNPSVWCEDLLALFAHVRGRMQVSIDETRLRRVLRRRIAMEAALVDARDG